MMLIYSTLFFLTESIEEMLCFIATCSSWFSVVTIRNKRYIKLNHNIDIKTVLETV